MPEDVLQVYGDARIEFFSRPDPIDGLPEELQPGELILVTYHHKTHCRRVTIDRLRQPGTVLAESPACARELGSGIRVVEPGDRIRVGRVVVEAVHAYNTPGATPPGSRVWA